MSISFRITTLETSTSFEDSSHHRPRSAFSSVTLKGHVHDARGKIELYISTSLIRSKLSLRTCPLGSYFFDDASHSSAVEIDSEILLMVAAFHGKIFDLKPAVPLFTEMKSVVASRNWDRFEK